MGRTAHSIIRRGSHLLPFLLWSIVTAIAAQRATESNGLTNIFAPESASASTTFEYSLGVLGLTGVIFVSVSSLVHAVAKICDTENGDRELVYTSVVKQTYRSARGVTGQTTSRDGEQRTAM